MLAFQVPMYALTKGFQIVIQHKAPILSRPGAFRGALPEPAQFAWFLGSLFVAVVGTLILYQLAVAALTTAAARAFLGERIEAGRALREGLARAPHLVGTFFLVLLWGALVLLVATLPGLIVAGLAFLAAPGPTRLTVFVGGAALALLSEVVAALYLLLRYALVSEVVVIERRTFLAALRRSASLMAGRVGDALVDNCKLRASILYAVNFCISIAVVVVTSLPTAALYAVYGVSPFDPERYDPARVPLWASVPLDVIGVFAQSAVAPFGLLAVIVFYFDIRIKREGFDLELLATRLGKSP